MNHAADREADPAGGGRVVLTIPAKPEYVVLGRLAVAALGGRAGLSAETVADLKMAVTEACETLLGRVGAGALGGLAADLEVSFDLEDDRWLVTVTGLHGSAPAAVASEAAASAEPADEFEDLGPAIIRELVDELELGRMGDQPPRLRFVKTVR